MKRILPIALAGLLALAVVVPAHAAVTVTAAELADTDVVVADGASARDDELTRLKAAANDFAARGYPTKFVLVPPQAAGDDLNAEAARLRKELGVTLGGLEKIDVVLLLAPRAYGISADAFDSEIADAFAAERENVERDRVTGTVNVVDRLADLDEAAALPGDPTSPKRDISLWIWVLGGVVLLLGLVAMVFARRAAARGAAALAAQDRDDAARAADDGAPPPDQRQ